MGRARLKPPPPGAPPSQETLRLHAPPPAIHADMTVAEVLARHPGMLAAFAEAGFKPLLNPIMRHLFAGVTTLAGAARKKRWDAAQLERFVQELNRIALLPPESVADWAPDEAPSGPDAERHPWGVSLDNRGLEPPQPMIRILGLLETLGPGERLEARNDREPALLLPRLNEAGYHYRTEALADGSWHVEIWKP